MVLGFLTTSLLSIVCFAISVYFGFSMEGRANLQQHILFGLFATFLVTLAQSMTMFYFIGTGKQVKELVISHSITEGFRPPNQGVQSARFPAGTLGHAFHHGDDDSRRRCPYEVDSLLGTPGLATALYFQPSRVLPRSQIHDRAQRL